jgi:CBS domain containing-hemolysin-like protein
MNIFAKDYTARVLKGTAATVFFWIDTLLTIVPLVIVTWVLFKLVAATRQRIALSNAFIVLSFVIIWRAAIWRLNREFNTVSYELTVTPLPAAAEPKEATEPAPAAPAGPIIASLLTDVVLAEGQDVHRGRPRRQRRCRDSAVAVER